MCTTRLQAQRSEEASGPLELVGQTGVRHHVGAGTHTQVV